MNEYMLSAIDGSRFYHVNPLSLVAVLILGIAFYAWFFWPRKQFH